MNLPHPVIWNSYFNVPSVHMREVTDIFLFLLHSLGSCIIGWIREAPKSHCFFPVIPETALGKHFQRIGLHFLIQMPSYTTNSRVWTNNIKCARYSSGTFFSYWHKRKCFPSILCCLSTDESALVSGRHTSVSSVLLCSFLWLSWIFIGSERDLALHLQYSPLMNTRCSFSSLSSTSSSSVP